jgi:outer membrane receptor protein involved in Fe transport
MPSLAPLPAFVAAAILVAPGPATSQSTTTGAIHGRVTDKASGAAIEGVNVVVTSTAHNVTEYASTAEDGTYKVDGLPPGNYLVSFFHGEQIVHRDRIVVDANVAVGVFQKMTNDEAIIHVRSHQADVDTTDPGLRTKMRREVMRILPMGSGGTQSSVAMMAAGTSFDGEGVAVSGSSSFENRTLLDGADTTGIQFGTVGTPVLGDFLEEVEVITAGYNAEYGRATGGFINAVTRSGTNRLQGSLFGYLSPGALIADRDRTPSQLSPIDARRDLAYQTDFGFDLGGPIIKDKAWFYVGLAPSLTRYDTTRRIMRRTDCRAVRDDGTLSECDRRPINAGGHADGQPDIDPATDLFVTEELDRRVLRSRGDALSALGKINVAVRPEHQGQVSVVAQPQRGVERGAFGTADATSRDYRALTTDVAVKWTSQFDDSRSEIETVIGWHRSTYDADARDNMLNELPAEVLRYTTLGALAAYDGESTAAVRGCTDGGADDPYPLIGNCNEDAGYRVGGPGAIAHDREERRSVRVGLTRRQQAFGNHELKAGVDIEDNTLARARLLSGGAFLDNQVALGRIEATRWVQLAPIDTMETRFDNTCADSFADTEYTCDFLAGERDSPGTSVTGKTLNWAAYLRDSWQIRPNLTLDAGVRYEEQRLRYAEELQGTTDALTGNELDENAMVLRGMIAPRVGLVYDWTKEGRAKAFAHWGRFYESIPMQINDRSFGGEVLYNQTFDAVQCGTAGPNGITPGGGCLADETLEPINASLFGSSGVLVAPDLKAQYMDEALVGAEMEIADDAKLGVSLQHRSLGRVIEDVSTDGAATYLIANPGEWSREAEADLMAEIASTADPEDRARLEHQLELFKGIRLFDRPRRDHTALHITLTRRFARGLFLQASYVYARTRGNYPGLLSYDNGQADPNISSQYDLIELLANRNGPLPQDRPHYLKLDAAKVFDLKQAGILTVSGRYRAHSGVPVDVLAPHYAYGGDESFLLPRGAMGRTGFEHVLDVHIGYGRRLGKTTVLEVFADVFNLYDHQGTFNVDETYALNVAGNAANPIVGGSYEDVIWAKGVDPEGVETDTPLIRNPNFRRPTVRYAPMSARFGVRLTF